MEHCIKCGRQAEYVAPEIFCRYCWVDWWYEDANVSRSELRKLKKEGLVNIKMTYDMNMPMSHVPLWMKNLVQRSHKSLLRSLRDRVERTFNRLSAKDKKNTTRRQIRENILTAQNEDQKEKFRQKLWVDAVQRREHGPLQPPHKPINSQGGGQARYEAALKKYTRKMAERGFKV